MSDHVNDYDIFRVRSEVILFLMHKFSLTQDDVLCELSILVKDLRDKKKQNIRFNTRGWNTRSYVSNFRDQKIRVSISLCQFDGLTSIRISIPNYCSDCVFNLRTFIRKSEDYVNKQLENILE